MMRPFSALQELGDSTRLKVFLAILGVRKNVSQIVAELGLAQPQVSYHLRKLKDAELAVEERDGRWVWYQANWDAADRNLRDFIDLMARWAEDAGLVETRVGAAAGGGGDASGGAAGAGDAADPEPELVGIQPVKSRTRGSGVMRSSIGRGRRRKVRPQPTEKRSRVGEAADRPVVERPKKRDSDMDDFLL